MEPERPKVDRKVLGFREVECVRSGGFCHRDDGVCRLIPRLEGRLFVCLKPVYKPVRHGRACQRPSTPIRALGLKTCCVGAACGRVQSLRFGRPEQVRP